MTIGKYCVDRSIASMIILLVDHTHRSRKDSRVVAPKGDVHPCNIQTQTYSVSFANDIRAALVAHPNLVQPARIYVNTCAWAKGFFLWMFIFGICDGQLPVEDKVCSKSTVCVWRVVGVSVSSWKHE